MNPFRRWAALIVVAVSLIVLGACATQTAIESGDPAVIYFAAVEDYNTAKVAAIAAIPVVELDAAEAILAAVVRADREIHRIDELRRAAQVTESDYQSATVILRGIRDELRRRAGGER